MIELIIDQRRKDLGGFEVGRVLPHAPRRSVGPFVFFDHMGPADMPAGLPRTVDVRFQLEVHGSLAALLSLGQAQKAENPTGGACGVSLGAGAGFEPATFRL